MKSYLLLVVLCLLVVSCGLRTTPTPRFTPTPEPTSTYVPTPVHSYPTVRPVPTKVVTGLTLEPGWDWERGEYGTRYIVGSVKNHDPREYDYVQITFRLYDKKGGSQVGTAMDNISDLAANATWKFKALVFEDEATVAQFHEITSW